MASTPAALMLSITEQVAEARLPRPSASQGVLSPPGVAPPRAGKGPVGPADVRMEGARELERASMEKDEGRAPPATLGGGTAPRARQPVRPSAGAAPPLAGDRTHAVDTVASPAKDSFVVGDVWMGAAHAGSQAALMHSDRFAASLGSEFKPPGPSAVAGETPRPDAAPAPGLRQLATPPDFPADRGFGRGIAAAPPGAPSTQRTAAELGKVPGRRNATEIADGSLQRTSVQWGGHAGPADTTGVAAEGSGSGQVAASEGVPTPEPMVATGRGTALYSGGRGASGGDPGASVKRWARADHDLAAAAKERGGLERKREEKQGALASAEKARLEAAAATRRAGNAADRAKAERAENAAIGVWIAAKHELAKIEAGIEEQRGKERRARVERDWNGDRLDPAEKQAAAALTLKMDADPASERRREREERAEKRREAAEARAEQRRARKGEAWNRHREERQERLREKRRGREERQEAARTALALSPPDFAKWTAAKASQRLMGEAIREQQAIVDDPNTTSEEKAAARREIAELEAQEAIARADQQWIEDGGFPLDELDCCKPEYARCRPPCLPGQRCDCVKPEPCGPSKKPPGEKGKGLRGGVPPGLPEETVTRASEGRVDDKKSPEGAAPEPKAGAPREARGDAAPAKPQGAAGADPRAVSPEGAEERWSEAPPQDDGDGESEPPLPDKPGTFVERGGKYYIPTVDDDPDKRGWFGVGVGNRDPCKDDAPSVLVVWEHRAAGRFAVIRDRAIIERVWRELCAQIKKGLSIGESLTDISGVEIDLIERGVASDSWFPELFAAVLEAAEWFDAAKEIVKERIEGYVDLVELAAHALTEPAIVWEELRDAVKELPASFVESFRDRIERVKKGEKKAVLELAIDIAQLVSMLTGVGAAVAVGGGMAPFKQLLARIARRVREARKAVVNGTQRATEKLGRVRDTLNRGLTEARPVAAPKLTRDTPKRPQPKGERTDKSARKGSDERQHPTRQDERPPGGSGKGDNQPQDGASTAGRQPRRGTRKREEKPNGAGSDGDKRPTDSATGEGTKSSAGTRKPEVEPPGSKGDAGGDTSRGLSGVRPPRGRWQRDTAHMSDRAADYQGKVTGRRGEKYTVNERDFDGVSPRGDELLEAKGPGYEWMVDTRTGAFRPGVDVVDQFLDQARGQLRAAPGAKITWHFADKRVADAARALFRENGIVGIDIRYTPP